VDDITELLGGEIQEPVWHVSIARGGKAANVCIPLTRPNRCRGTKTCGTLSFS
jgi:hypothetical protein